MLDSLKKLNYTVFMVKTNTTRAIELGTIAAGESYERKSYRVMVHASGRGSNRTGMKVHLATANVWKSGGMTLGGTECSGKRVPLMGHLVKGDQSFAIVNCEKCIAKMKKENFNMSSFLLDI